MNSPVILITGAGKGIGKAVVEEIVRRKSTLDSPKLMLTSRALSDLEDLQVKVQNEGLQCEILPLELSEHPTRTVLHTVQKFGRLDKLIHSAGVGRFGNFLELTRSDLEYTMKTNVEASFLLLQSAYSQIKNQKPTSFSPIHRGDLLWITSVASSKPFEHSAIYCMSKYAQRGLLEVMRLYGRQDGIRVIDVQPGAVHTPMWGEVPVEMVKKMMLPEDIAKTMIDILTLHPRSSAEEILIRPIAGDL